MITTYRALQKADRTLLPFYPELSSIFNYGVRNNACLPWFTKTFSRSAVLQSGFHTSRHGPQRSVAARVWYHSVPSVTEPYRAQVDLLRQEMRVMVSDLIRPVRSAGLLLATVQQSRVYDVLMRLPILGYGMLIGWTSVIGLAKYIVSAAPTLPSVIYQLNVAMRVSDIAFFVLLAIMAAVRGRARGKARGVEPRISALVGTFLVYAIALFPRRELSVGGEIAATALILLGTSLAAYVLTQLGRSFSVMAEARRLVTTGVYRIVRHPLYIAEEIAAIGFVLQFLSYWTLLLLAAHIGFQLRRMRNEEAVLIGTFPEYDAYKAKIARLIPGIY